MTTTTMVRKPSIGYYLFGPIYDSKVYLVRQFIFHDLTSDNHFFTLRLQTDDDENDDEGAEIELGTFNLDLLATYFDRVPYD